jgi:hypothetical protein
VSESVDVSKEQLVRQTRRPFYALKHVDLDAVCPSRTGRFRDAAIGSRCIGHIGTWSTMA